MKRKLNRTAPRKVGSRVSAWLLTLLCVAGLARAQDDTIKVGVLHSLSGTMAISEVSLRDVTLMAIEEINAQGGVLGRQLEPVVVDGTSGQRRRSHKPFAIGAAGQRDISQDLVDRYRPLVDCGQSTLRIHQETTGQRHRSMHWHLPVVHLLQDRNRRLVGLAGKEG